MIEDKIKVKDEICYCEGCSTYFICDTRKILPDYDGSGPYRLKPCSKGCEENIKQSIRIIAHYMIWRDR